MNQDDKKFFWIANLVFYITATLFLISEGVFKSLNFIGYIIVLVSYLFCSFFLYLYVKGRNEN